MTLLLAGCDEMNLQLGKLFFPNREHVVVLEPSDFQSSDREYTFPDAEAPSVRLESNRLCFVLGGKDRSAPGDLDKVRELFERIGIRATVRLSDGSSHSLDCPSAEWNLDGKILHRREHSACLTVACGEQMEAGKLVRAIAFSSSEPIAAKGLYWVGTDPL